MSKEKNIIAKNYEPVFSMISTLWENAISLTRGQFIYRAEDGDISNEWAVNSEFLGICVRDLKIPKGVVGFLVKIYIQGFFYGKEIYDLQTDSVKAHLDEHAKSEGYSSVYEMQYHDIKLVR